MKENNLEQVILFAFVSNPVVWRRWKLLPFQTELPLGQAALPAKPFPGEYQSCT